MSTAESSKSLAAVLAILAEYGRGAFDTTTRSKEETKALFEAWVSHLGDGMPSPTDASNRTGWRDWPGLAASFAGHRTEELDFVEENVDALRRLIWNLIAEFVSHFTAGSEASAEITSVVHELQSAVKSKRGEELERAVNRSVKRVLKILDKKRKEDEHSVHVLSKRLDKARESLEQARHSARIDGLTKLFNRSAFDEQTEKAVLLSGLTEAKPSLLLIDIDHFKTVNDQYGHPFGDEVLRVVANTLSTSFPRKTDFCARYGGEELAVILPQESTKSAAKLAERFRRNLAEIEFGGEDPPMRVTVSIGVARYRSGEEVGQWIERTDRALYHAKGTGRDRVVVDE